MSKRTYQDYFEVGDRIVRYLRDAGRRHIKSPELEEHFGLSGSEVREIVNYMRCTGQPFRAKIGSDITGYWWAWEYDGVRPAVEHMHSRAMAILSAVKGMRQAFGVKQERQGQLL